MDVDTRFEQVDRKCARRAAYIKQSQLVILRGRAVAEAVDCYIALRMDRMLDRIPEEFRKL